MNKDISQKVHAISGGLRDGMAMGVKAIADKQKNDRKQLIDEYNLKLKEREALNRELYELIGKIGDAECDFDCHNCPFYQGYKNVIPNSPSSGIPFGVVQECGLGKGRGYIVVKRPDVLEEEI